MAIPIEEVRRIAVLARLRFSEDELETMATELENILDYVERLDELEISDTPPTSCVTPGDTALRPDIPLHRIEKDEGLQNAPDTDGVYFRVPRVIK